MRKSILGRLAYGCLVGMAAASAGYAAPIDFVDARLPAYQPQPVSLDKQHGYIMPDGSVQVVGFDDMAGMMAGLNKLFAQSHPAIRFKMVMKGNGPAIPALTYDATAFAPMGGGATMLQLLPYEKIYGNSKAEPVAALAIKIAHASLNPAAKLGPLGVIVNKSNPIKSLTMEQVTSMFAYGSVPGDITTWSQLGLGGKLAGAQIHPTGLSEDAYDRPEDLGMGEYMTFQKMQQFPGYPFSPRYERKTRYAEVVERVSTDPAAVGLVALNKVNPKVRVVPVVASDGTLTSGSAADIVSGKYPYDRYMYIYVRRPVGTQFDPLVKEYLRMVLSKQGQQIIARDAKGYLPLSAKEVDEQLARLERAENWQPRSKQGPTLNFPFPSPEQ